MTLVFFKALATVTMFELHPRLAADTLPIGDLPLCRLLLMNDARYPWVILTPRHMGAVEIFDLSAPDRALFIEETAYTAERLKFLTGARKMNIASLGNLVPQLHCHVVARADHDDAWPNPVWGYGTARPWPYELATQLMERLAALLPMQSRLF